MSSTADFKNGLVIEYNNDLYAIVEFLHVKPGKGPAFVRTKLKSITSGKVIDNTFNSGVKVTIARVERRAYQFTFQDDYGYHFMDSKTFEELILNQAQIPNSDLLKEGQEVEITIHTDTDKPIICELPLFVDLKITHTEPGIRGDTATNVLKPATTETGASIKVPLFIGQDEIIRVDTRTRTYHERVKQ
ncbi:MAG: elongation factor P [Chitinophagaceae bacterium]|nr:elongation factor P [Chitinophagaceae bacterium]